MVAAALCARNSRWTQDYLLRAKDLPELEALVRANPKNSAAQYHLGKRYYLARRFTEARAAYEESVRLDPDWARAHLGLALALFEDRELVGAREEFESALRLDSRLAWAEYMLGKIAWAQGDMQQAVAHVGKSAELDPRSDQAWYGLGACRTRLRQYDDAIAALRNAVARQPDDAHYHAALGELLIYRGTTAEGRTQLERALQIDPGSGLAYSLLGKLLAQSGAGNDLDLAESLLLRATKAGPPRPGEVWFDLGQLYIKKGQYAKAVVALRNSIRQEPRDERVYYALSNAQRRMGDVRSADAAERKFRRLSALHVNMQELQARVSHKPDDAVLQLQLARVYRELGLQKEAIDRYEDSLRLDPKQSAAAKELEQLVALYSRNTLGPSDREFSVMLPDHGSK